jgi:hypothetical protein
MEQVMRKIHRNAFTHKAMASRGWHELEDNPASNHWMNLAISRYDDAML